MGYTWTSEIRQGIAFMNELLHEGGDDTAVARLLLPYLQKPEYLLRSKAFAFLHWRPLPTLRDELLSVLENGEEREWELRALAALEDLGDQAAAARLHPFLFQSERPLLIRGSFWVLATLGGDEAQEAIAAFLLHPRRCYLKDGFIAAALARLLLPEAERTRWENRLASSEDLVRAYDALVPLMKQKSFVGVYPFGDYLLLMARQQGIGDRLFQRTMYYRL